LEQISNLKIGIPGKFTTANFLLHFAFPNATNTREYLFSEIEDSLIKNDIDLGLIIHENRFTYKSKGLKKIVDLGEYWENKTGLPIPLGGIGIKRGLPQEVKTKVDRLIKKSIQFAFQHPSLSLPYITLNAQEMDEEIVRKHIHLYVNEYSENIGEKGKEAVIYLFNKINNLATNLDVWV
jgi:1,4-dihydroxy-6-naphthoate synthase